MRKADHPRALCRDDGWRAPIENGAVVVLGNRITAVGRSDEVRGRHPGELIDLGDSILLPGLINAHCHLDYTLLRGRIPKPASFAGWIRAINAEKAALKAEDYRHAIRDGFAEAAQFGTTTIANLEAFPELLAEMPRPQLRTWWFAEMIDVRQSIGVEEVYAQMRAAVASWPGGVGLAPHAPFTASQALHAEAARIGAREDLPLTTHLAESREESEMFGEARGDLYDFMRSIGRSMDDCGRSTPCALMLQRACWRNAGSSRT